MLEKLFLILLTEHRGKVIGISMGLLASILFISFGFWKTVFIIFCIFIGYFIGKKIDENTNFESWIKQFLKQKY